MSKKAAGHHKKASEHLTHAARHHGEAAKHHEAGSHEKAAHHAHLAVEPQQVVLGKTEAADRCFGLQTGMRAMPIVTMQPVA